MLAADQILANAIAALDVDAVSRALAMGADVAHVDKFGDNLLDECVRSVTVDHMVYDPRAGAIMQQLLNAGTQPDQRSEASENSTALHHAAILGQFELQAILLEAGANPSLPSHGETALDIAEFDHYYHQVEGRCRYRIVQRSDFTTEPDLDDGTDLCMVWRHQQAIPLLRRYGAHRLWELEPRPITDFLSFNADWQGGLATRNGIVNEHDLAALSVDVHLSLRCWLDAYANPWIDGFDAPTVAAFDYDSHAAAGLDLARRIAHEIHPDVPFHFRALHRAELDRNSHRSTCMVWTPGEPHFRVNPDD